MANVEGIIREAIRVFRAGNKGEARSLLEKAVEMDPYNEQAWLWLSSAVETPEEQRTCLENVLVINPGNDKAKQGLRLLGIDPEAGAGAAAAGAPPAAEPAAPSASPFTDFDIEGEADFEIGDEHAFSSVEWGDPSDQPAAPRGREAGTAFSADEMDDWIGALNIGKKDAAEAEPPPPPAAMPDDDPFGGAEDLFGLDDFEEFEEDQAPASTSMTDGPFGTGPLDEDVLDSVTSSRSASPPPPPPRSPAPARSPVDDDLEDFLDDRDLLTGGIFAATGDYDVMDVPDAPGDEDYFSYIPKEIKATRLPGTNEGLPILMLLSTVVLVLLNIGALLMLVSSMS